MPVVEVERWEIEAADVSLPVTDRVERAGAAVMSLGPGEAGYLEVWSPWGMMRGGVGDVMVVTDKGSSIEHKGTV